MTKVRKILDQQQGNEKHKEIKDVFNQQGGDKSKNI